ncbi:MAG: Mrp/NBP35 family ATP-binding protein [Deltaproteobacteria bacterium]|nr:Mrp/NBP35 family ATP-binding protein [Deltaproteobacteria bacterium]
MVAAFDVREALKAVVDPELKRNLVDLQMVKDIDIEDGRVRVTLALTTLACPMKKRFVESVKEAVGKLPGVTSTEVELTVMSREELDKLFPKHPLKGIERVSRFIAVASGKGGVGKTTVAINLALALAREDLNVGLLDADMYGPSIPTMLGLMQRPRVEGGMLLPLEKFGLKVMSFGFFVEEKQALIWRGPLVSKTLKQLMDDVMWGDLDCLVVDLPPGTGDPSITVAQSIPSVSVVMVTTPQEVALADVRKAIGMFRDMNIRIAGIVENMSYFLHGDSKEKIEIFGSGGGAILSRESGLPLLGSIPIDLGLRKGGDAGVPLLYDSPNSETGEIFKGIAKRLISQLAISRKAVA